jgi:hypothetical protein
MSPQELLQFWFLNKHGIVQFSRQKLHRLKTFEAKIQREKSSSEDVQFTWSRHRICTDVPHVQAEGAYRKILHRSGSSGIFWQPCRQLGPPGGSSGPHGKTRACRRKIMYDPTPTSRYSRGIRIATIHLNRLGIRRSSFAG